ncbi:MAG TPA: hypothetical protein VFD36_29540 [Kofleriaceae bacterium]|nr:hypothetical protein [Kofleriaceae bacterium]
MFAIRIKEYDRHIERTNQAILAATAAYDAADADAKKRIGEIGAMAQRPVVPAARYGGNHDNASVGFSAVFDAKQQIDRYTNTRELLLASRAQIQWLSDCFDMNTMYELDGGDLVTLGLGTPVNFASRISSDPLEV